MTRATFVVTRIGLDGGAIDTDGHFTARIPMMAYSSREQADAYCREQELRARRELRPFDLGDSHYPEEVLEGVEAMGLPTPESVAERYGPRLLLDSWWDRIVGELTDEQREALWRLFRVPPLFEVRGMRAE